MVLYELRLNTRNAQAARRNDALLNDAISVKEQSPLYLICL